MLLGQTKVCQIASVLYFISSSDGDSCPIFNDTAGCTIAFVADYGDDLGFLSDTCAQVIREGRINMNENADEIESKLFFYFKTLNFHR